MSKRIVYCTIISLLVLLAPNPTHADHKGPPHKKVLLLNSYHQTMTWVDNIVHAVENELDPVKNDLILHIENMDTKRHYSQPYLDALYRAYKTKYNNIDFDLILASDNHAFDFLRQHRDDLFPGVPVVFSGVEGFKDEQIAGLDDFTGVVETFNSAATLKIALKNHPNTKQVFIINDYLKTGRVWERIIQQQLEPFASRVKLTYSGNISIDELERQVSLLDEHSIVMLGVYFSDQDGHYMTFEHMGKSLARSSNVPVYCLLDFNIVEGVVGGNVIGGYFQGHAMAIIAQQILQGEAANNIPVLKKGANRYVFDAKQLKRFNVKVSNLPKESIIVNQFPPLFQVSKAALWVFLGVIALISVFVFTLFLQLRKRKLSELAYRESELRFRDIATSVGDFIWEVDSQGVYKYCSEKIFALLGYTAEELLGKTPYSLMPPGQAEIARKFMEANIAGGESFRDFENLNIHKNGKRVFLLTSGNPIISDDGSYVGYRGVDKDITEIKMLQEKAIRAAQLASVGELSSMIAHEVNNPLSGVIGYAQVFLNNACDDCRNKELLERIIKEGERMAKTVKGLLHFSYDSGGQRTMQDIKPIINDALSLMSRQIEKKGMRLDVELSEYLPRIKCNPQQIEQVVLNIVRNAYHALLEGTLEGSGKEIIKVCVELVELDNQRFIQITIANNGPNIPPDLIEKINEPFFTTKPAGSGTGLGLSISNDIMKIHGGMLEIRSETGDFTEMILRIPVEESNQSNIIER